jgi:hypothetical protein
VKKTAKILFLSMYLLVSVGITLSLHFCGDSITSVQMIPFATHNNRCGCDDVTTPDDCCKTEIKSIQLNDDQIAVQIDQLTSPQTDVNLWAETPFEESFSSNSIRTVLPASSPPEAPPLYILHCTLLI